MTMMTSTSGKTDTSSPETLPASSSAQPAATSAPARPWNTACRPKGRLSRKAAWAPAGWISRWRAAAPASIGLTSASGRRRTTERSSVRATAYLSSMCLQAARRSTCPESGASSSKAPQKAFRSRWGRPAAPYGRWRNSTARATVRSTGRWYIWEDRQGVKARSRPSASNTGRDIPASSPSRSSISATSGASATPANSIS